MSRRVIVPTEDARDDLPERVRNRPIWAVAVVAVLGFAALDGGEPAVTSEAPVVGEQTLQVMPIESGPEWILMAQLPGDASSIHLGSDVQLAHRGNRIEVRRGWYDEWRPATSASDGRPLIGRLELISAKAELIGILEDPDTRHLMVARSSDGFEWTLTATSRPFSRPAHAAFHEGEVFVVIDRGNHWEAVVFAADGGVTAVRHGGEALRAGWVDDLGLAVVTGTDPVEVQRSVDMGATWEEVTLAVSGATEIFAGRLIVEQGSAWQTYEPANGTLTTIQIPDGDAFGRLSVGRTTAIRWLEGTAWLSEDLEAWVRADRGIGELVTGHSGRMWLVDGSPHVEVYSPSGGLSIYRLDQRTGSS